MRVFHFRNRDRFRLSLREIGAALANHQAHLYHVGAAPPKRSTLVEANAQRPADLFAELFGNLLKQVGRGLRDSLVETTYRIDPTSLRLDRRSARRPRFSAKVSGAKVHVVDAPDADRPIYGAVTPAWVNDIPAAEAVPIEAGATSSLSA